MSSTTSPTVSRRWLALEMRRLREDRGLPQTVVAKALGCQATKVSLIETGKRPLQDNDLKTLLELFDVPNEAREQYLAEYDNSRGRGWWERFDDHTVPPWFGDFIGLEQGAERVRAYQPALVHGLLQRPDYTAALLRASTVEESEEKIDRVVELRRIRQTVLSRPLHPLQFSTIMDEAALRHVVGSPNVTRSQLEHLISLSLESENISIQVIPFDRGGAYEAGYGAFTILTFPFNTDHGVVYMEHRAGAVYLDELSVIDAYSSLFRRLSKLALTEEESLEMLRECAEEYASFA